MRVVDIQTMQAIERTVIEKHATPSLTLMERAGRSASEWVRRMVREPEPGYSPRITVLAGGGKNGGDGLVCARFLAREGFQVRVLLVESKHMAPETLANLESVKHAKIPLESASRVFPKKWIRYFGSADLVVDALLGIGLSGPVREPASSALHALAASGARILALDLPSGLNADTGQPEAVTVRAERTLTFGLPKKGLFAEAAAGFVGQLEVETLGFPSKVLAGTGGQPEYYDLSTAVLKLPDRAPHANKFSSGRVLVVGGSRAYHGAALLAARGAARTGAGYVTLAYPEPLDPIMRSQTLEEVCRPQPVTAKGVWTSAAIKNLLALARSQDAVVIGPGLGLQENSRAMIGAFLDRVKGPKTLVMDADALAVLSGKKRFRRRSHSPEWILTPHEGEAGELLGRSSDFVRKNRREAVEILSERFSAVVLLKGHPSLVKGPGAPLRIIGGATQALATAGTGDVLSGVIAALAAQRLIPSESACLGGYLHGLAGTLAACDPGGLGVRAREVADCIPRAIGRVRRHPRLNWAD